MPDSTVYNAHEDTAASILAARHPARASNAYHAGTVSDHAVYEYTAVNIGKVLDDCGTKIPMVGNVFKPTTLDQVAKLDEQVTFGNVVKITL